MKKDCKTIVCFRCGAKAGKSTPDCPKSQCARPREIKLIFELDMMRKFRIAYENLRITQNQGVQSLKRSKELKKCAELDVSIQLEKKTLN